MDKSSFTLQTKSDISDLNTITKNKKSATIPVAEAAGILGVSPQTLRLLLQMGAAEWGIAYKLPHSRHYSYIIFANKFYETLGITGGDANC